MGNDNKAAVNRIDFGGRVSGEVLTLLGFAVQQSFYEKFADLDIEHAIIGLTGETDKVVEIVEEYMNEPFFDGAYPPETKKKPFDIKTWGKTLGRHIVLSFDNKAVDDIKESLANLRGDCRFTDKIAIKDWLRSCGRAVRERAATKDKKWVHKMVDEFYWEIFDCGLDLKIRTSIICLLIGIEFLKEVLWEERGMALFEIVGKTFGEYIAWLIESQLAVQ